MPNETRACRTETKGDPLLGVVGDNGGDANKYISPNTSEPVLVRGGTRLPGAVAAPRGRIILAGCIDVVEMVAVVEVR